MAKQVLNTVMIMILVILVYRIGYTHGQADFAKMLIEVLRPVESGEEKEPRGVEI